MDSWTKCTAKKRPYAPAFWYFCSKISQEDTQNLIKMSLWKQENRLQQSFASSSLFSTLDNFEHGHWKQIQILALTPPVDFYQTAHRINSQPLLIDAIRLSMSAYRLSDHRRKRRFVITPFGFVYFFSLDSLAFHFPPSFVGGGWLNPPQH